MKKISRLSSVLSLIVLAFIVPQIAFASSCNQIGNTTFCDDGTSYNQIGNTTFGSDGTSYTNIGNTTFSSDGTSYNRIGNTTFSSDGTSYSQIGNTTFGSDGSSYSRIGNTTFGTGGNVYNSCPTNSSYDSSSGKCKCSSGYVVSGSSCVYNYSYPTTPTYNYPSAYSESTNTCPLNSRTSTTDSTKCQCNAGYQPNTTKDGCIVVPTKTNDQACSDTYGINSNWDGTKTSAGMPNCGCQSGYVWNLSKTSCIAPPITTTLSTKTSNSFVSGLTIMQINAIISLLYSFGADATTIARLSQKRKGVLCTFTLLI